MRITQLIFQFSLLFMVTCKSPQQANGTDPKSSTATGSNDPIKSEKEETQITNTADLKMQDTKDTTYRLIVSFISIGEGTDLKAKELLENHLSEWKTKNGKEIHYQAFPWGREGETDFCFPLSELKEAQQKEFISEIKTVYKGHDLVQFAENEPCRHKRN